MDQALRKKKIKNYCSMLSIVNESIDELLFVCDLIEDFFYLVKEVDEAYSRHLPLNTGIHLQQLLAMIYPYDQTQITSTIDQIKKDQLDTLDMQFRFVDKKNETHWIKCRGYVLKDEKIVIGGFSESALREKVDPLTGLLNYTKFIEDFEEKQKKKKNGHLMVIGIDNFTDINLRYGREHANNIIREIAKILENGVEESVSVYRLDGDHFLANLENYSQSQVKKYYRYIQTAVHPFCTVSAGYMAYPMERIEDASLMVQYVESALERAKKNGKNCMEKFSSEDNSKYLYRLELQEEMMNSIEHGFYGFELYYQPVVKSKEYRLAGAEALLRFHSSQYGIISPTVFIPILERTGRIVEVGKWVMRKALQQCKEWRKTIPNFFVNVNVSYLQLAEDNFNRDVLNCLKEADLPGEAVYLELTESTKLENYDLFNVRLKQLKEQGIHVSIDDFGTGYSSLSYLKNLAVDEVKIDRSFVSHIQENSYNERLVDNIIVLAHSVQMEVCCEGVEKIDELTYLERIGPDFLQGYLFSMPLPVTEFEEKYIHSNYIFKEIVEKMSHENIQSKEERNVIMQTGHLNYEILLNQINPAIMIVDPKTHQIEYMNEECKRLTASYNYENKTCGDIIMGDSNACEKMAKDGKGQFQIYAKRMKCFLEVDMKSIKLNGRDVNIVQLHNVDHTVSSNRLNEFRKTELMNQLYEISWEHKTMEDRMQAALKYLCDYHKADYAGIYLYDEKQDIWIKNFEYKTKGIRSKVRFFKKNSYSYVREVVEKLNHSYSFIVKNEDEGLLRQTASSNILSGIYVKNQLRGFVTVEQCMENTQEMFLAEKMAHIVSKRLFENTTPVKETIQLFEMQNSRQILQNTRLGLWTLEINLKNHTYSLMPDEMFRELLSFPDSLSAEKNYQYWYNQIHQGFYQYVKNGIDMMMNTDNIIEMEYTWEHPKTGSITVRCVGLKVYKNEDVVVLEGYSRILNDMKQLRIISKGVESDIFEYQEYRKSIYFNTKRSLIYGKEKREQNFPDCWIQREIVHPHFVKEFEDLFKNIHKKDVQTLNLMLKNKKGEYAWFEMVSRHIGYENVGLNSCIVQIHPMEDKEVAELDYERTRDFYHSVLSDNMAYAEINVTQDELIKAGGNFAVFVESNEYAGLSYSAMITRYSKKKDAGFDAHQLHASTLNQRFSENKHRLDMQFKITQDKEEKWCEIVVHMFKDTYTQTVYALLYMRDITGDMRQKLETEKAAQLDALTGVYNRATFTKQVNFYMNLVNKEEMCALVLLDMDNFKFINDTQGHLVGDSLLKQFAEILKSNFRGTDYIGRYGGDEFMVFIKDIPSNEQLDMMMKRLYQNFSLSDIQCSCGVRMMTSDNTDYSEIFKQADEALYSAKKNGKNHYIVYQK